MPFVSGYLNVREGHPDQGPVDPSAPVDPGYGFDMPIVPSHGLPHPPTGVWPPPSATHPIVPAPPGVPPGTIWPPPPGMDNTLPGGPPGHPSAPGGPPSKFWVVAGIPGIGWRYVCVDPSLVVDGGPASPSGRPDHTLPGAQPK